MNVEDINKILTEISKLQKQGITLSDRLNNQKILSDYEIIAEQSVRGSFTLAREYVLVKKIQRGINGSLYSNDVSVFIDFFYKIVTKLQRKLEELYERRREISEKLKNIRQIIEQQAPESKNTRIKANKIPGMYLYGCYI